MLADANVIAIVAVKDLAAAKRFYGETLGLKQAKEDLGGVSYACGRGTLFVYESEFAGTNKATSADWEVDNIEQVVAELKGKGVTFENYDMPGATKNGDVHVMGGMRAAWFKDPDGNILGISQLG